MKVGVIFVADEFKRSYNDKATACDFYCPYCKSNNNNKFRAESKKIFHRIGRSRMKQSLKKELKGDYHV